MGMEHAGWSVKSRLGLTQCCESQKKVPVRVKADSQAFSVDIWNLGLISIHVGPLHCVFLQGIRKPNKGLFHKLERTLETRIPNPAGWGGRLESAYFGHKGSKRTEGLTQLSGTGHRGSSPGVGRPWKAPGKSGGKETKWEGSVVHLESQFSGAKGRIGRAFLVLLGYTASLRLICVTWNHLRRRTKQKEN